MKRHPVIVIKLGTTSIVDERTHQPLLSTLALIVETAVNLNKNGYRVVLVSSGAIGVGLQRMNLPRRPKHLPQVQALAAIGQCRLMGLWDHLFERLQQPVAQILLTRNDIADRTQYLNAQNTFIELLNMGVIPIVNENDTLAVSEIKFGDNDTLSAITAGMVQADYLFLMTDVDCLYDKNPRKYPDAKPIEIVENISELTADVSSSGSALGTGGMSTKLVAARLATAAGVTTIITKSSKPGNVASIVANIEARKTAQRTPRSTPSPLNSNGTTTPLDESIGVGPGVLLPPAPLPPCPLHTRFLPSIQPVRDRRFWLLHGVAPRGVVYVDRGAARALADKAGLLPVGIIDVEGSFAQQECVRLLEAERNPRASPSSPAREIGRALVNYSSTEIKRIAGLRSTEIATVLGYADSEYVALRENVALLEYEGRSRPHTPTPETGKAGGMGTPAPATPTARGNLSVGLAGCVEG